MKLDDWVTHPPSTRGGATGDGAHAMPRTRRLIAAILALVLPMLVHVRAAPALAATPTLEVSSVTLVARAPGCAWTSW